VQSSILVDPFELFTEFPSFTLDSTSHKTSSLDTIGLMGRFLVTGGAGFIGSALTRRLIQQNHEVVVIDNLSKGIIANIPEGVKLFKFDLIQFPEFLVQDGKSFDAVFHLAGQSSGERSMNDPRTDLNSNVLSTYSIIKLAQILKIPKLVYSSSMAVYGEQERLPVSEITSPDPLTPYGVHKLASEQLLKIASKEFKISISVLRLFNVYGPGQDLGDKDQGMLSIYLSYALDNCPVLVKGSLLRLRDFIYIDDVIEAMKLVSKNIFPGYEVLNICTGVGTQISDLIQKIFVQVKTGNTKIQNTSGTPGDQFKIIGSTKLMWERYNWRYSVDLDSGLEKTLKSFNKV
jgi:UDP-glucose 4-epimerase